MVSINAMEEGRRKLQQIVAEQVEEGIRDALGADTASLIENQAASIAELEAERDRLAAIVERLPKTADGVPLYRGMKVYWRSQDPTTTRDGRTLVTYGVDEEGDFEGTDENGDWIPFDFGICSTAEAAAEETE